MPVEKINYIYCLFVRSFLYVVIISLINSFIILEGENIGFKFSTFSILLISRSREHQMCLRMLMVQTHFFLSKLPTSDFIMNARLFLFQRSYILFFSIFIWNFSFQYIGNRSNVSLLYLRESVHFADGFHYHKYFGSYRFYI